MKCSGTLRVVHEANQRVLKWTWTASDTRKACSFSKRLTLEELHKVIREFHHHWNSVNRPLAKVI